MVRNGDTVVGVGTSGSFLTGDRGTPGAMITTFDTSDFWGDRMVASDAIGAAAGKGARPVPNTRISLHMSGIHLDFDTLHK